LGECPAVVEDGDRAWMARQGMLDGQLRVLDRGGGLTGDKHAPLNLSQFVEAQNGRNR